MTKANGSEPYVLRTHEPGDIGVIVQRHGVLFAQEYNWDASFEALVAEIAAKFLTRVSDTTLSDNIGNSNFKTSLNHRLSTFLQVVPNSHK